jgi:hypothetical protein
VASDEQVGEGAESSHFRCMVTAAHVVIDYVLKLREVGLMPAAQRLKRVRGSIWRGTEGYEISRIKT